MPKNINYPKNEKAIKETVTLIDSLLKMGRSWKEIGLHLNTIGIEVKCDSHTMTIRISILRFLRRNGYDVSTERKVIELK